MRIKQRFSCFFSAGYLFRIFNEEMWPVLLPLKQTAPSQHCQVASRDPSIASSVVSSLILLLQDLLGEGNGNPLQCSCLENPRDGGAWWAAVYGVAQSRTRLKWLSSSSSTGSSYPESCFVVSLQGLIQFRPESFSWALSCAPRLGQFL